MSEETGDWVASQNKVTFNYLESIPYRDKLKKRLEKLWNYEKIGAPFKEGDYTYTYKNDGFYYSSYDKPTGSEFSAKTDQHKVYYHKLGTKQKDDELIYGGIAEEKHRYIYGTVTEDDKYLLISPRVSTSGNKLYIKDLSKPNSPLITVLDHTNSDAYVIDNVGSKLYLVTNLDASNRKM